MRHPGLRTLILAGGIGICLFFFQNCGGIQSFNVESPSTQAPSLGGSTGGNPMTSDNSVSGTAAASVGHALMVSTSHSTVSQGACPTYRSSSSSGCSTSADEMWMNYNDCSLGTSGATVNGVNALIPSAGSPMCGSFPQPPAGGTLDQQFVSAVGATTPGMLTLTGAQTIQIDDQTANLGNFDGASIATIVQGGYGISVGFDASGTRNSVTVAEHVVINGGADHSSTGSVTISEAVGSSSQTISGSVTVYANNLQVVGTCTFNNVGHVDSCCMPVSGSVTTTFSAGANVAPTNLGSLMIGKSETLTFTGCGTGTLQTFNGTVENVALDRCW